MVSTLDFDSDSIGSTPVGPAKHKVNFLSFMPCVAHGFLFSFDVGVYICENGGTGRRAGLKILSQNGVRVQIPLLAPLPPPW